MNQEAFELGLNETLQKAAGLFPAGFLTKANPAFRNSLARMVKMDRSVYRGLSTGTNLTQGSIPNFPKIDLQGLMSDSGGRSQGYSNFLKYLRERLTGLFDRPGLFHADTSPVNASVATRVGMTDPEQMAAHITNKLRNHHFPDNDQMNPLAKLDFRDMIRARNASR